MKTNATEDGLLIEPETAFEKRWLCLKFENSLEKSVHIKRGSTASFVIGLKIQTKGA